MSSGYSDERINRVRVWYFRCVTCDVIRVNEARSFSLIVPNPIDLNAVSLRVRFDFELNRFVRRHTEERKNTHTKHTHKEHIGREKRERKKRKYERREQRREKGERRHGNMETWRERLCRPTLVRESQNPVVPTSRYVPLATH